MALKSRQLYYDVHSLVICKLHMSHIIIILIYIYMRFTQAVSMWNVVDPSYMSLLYEFENWLLTLREKYSPRVLQNRVLRRLFGP